MSSRSAEPEILDDLAVSAGQIKASLDFMVWVNRFLGGTKAVLDYFERQTLPETFSVLDLACGAGDIPFSLVRRAQRKGKRISVTAIDLNEHCLEYARKNFSSPEIRFFKHPAFDLEKLGLFDYVISSMFFHHLTDEEIVSLLKLMARHARRGFLVNDLRRGILPYSGAFLISLFTLKPIVVHDARLSVKRAFTKKDFLKYREASGISRLQIEKKPVFRMTMSYAA